MKKKNIYLLLIIIAMYAGMSVDTYIENSIYKHYLNGTFIAFAFIINFLIFGWCVEHARENKVEPPSALLIILLSYFGVLIYFFKKYGFKGGLFNTYKAIGFLFVMVFVMLLTEIAVEIFAPERHNEQKVEVNKGIEAFDNGNYEAAFDDLHDLAILDNAEAQFKLAVMYDMGEGVKQDYKQAVYWYTKAAEQEHSESQFNLAIMYYKGLGVKQDYSQAFYWYKKAAEQGHSYAQYNLAEMYISGEGAQMNYKEAINWLLRASKQGASRAQFKLGAAYENGLGVDKDYDKSVHWYTKAAEQGYADAQNNLGLMYDKGQGVPQDYKVAAKWYLKAAEQGNVYAQANIGKMYQHGYGVDKNTDYAIMWVQRAAEQGYADAQLGLGLTYTQEDNVDIEKAKYWLNQAYENGVVEAKEFLELLEQL